MDHNPDVSHAPVISDVMSSLQIDDTAAQLPQRKSNPPTTSCNSKLTHLVVDSGVIIKRTNLTPLAENFWTITDVLEEIRDQNARKYLHSLPFEIKTREPTPEAMQAVICFARKTGDFAHLSRTDLRLMALTYMLESETRGVSHLNTEPRPSQTIVRDANGKCAQPRTEPCKYFNTPIGCKYGDQCLFEHTETTVSAKVDIPCRFFNTPEGCQNGDKCHFVHEESEESAEVDTQMSQNVVIPKVSESTLIKSRILGSSAPVTNEGGGEDDGKNWINLANCKHFTVSPFGNGQDFETPNGSTSQVACITTDFSMQNVMLQMGLKLISTDGMLIRRVKQWIFRCFACFATTFEMERLFCPKCGNNTLERVAFSVDKNGEIKYYLRSNRAVSLMGTKYSLPNPKGGRQGDLLLREDQLLIGMWGQRQRQHRKQKQSAFGHHVAQELGVEAERAASLQVGYGRMNPNAQRGRERRGKKKSNKK
uniref:RNAbinding protein NOB1 putative n=1 Tax=Albugo laibachii Nc14 TaxID=890382 RepID=F0WFK7_9STRA|nr:RNAbinding protein NOB1 putative [Albugo laibachii Nc14]CCA23297.1 RNAbinding protein NOB1 putative [Albugo laibachii Nc14]|eukprot:CCA23297.1 RNAbinding protein NOB1 putative [Albugo laibachii Nc14]